MSDERDVSNAHLLWELTALRRITEEVRADVKTQNGRVSSAETRIAVLEDRSSQASKDPTARNAGIAGIVASAGALIWQWVKS
jgi:hypothetical protein